MRIILTLLSFSVLVLFSCQKEISIELNNNTGGVQNGSAGSRLVKAVSKSGADSVVSVFVYDQAGKLISMTTSGIEGGTPINNQTKLVRNGQGIVQKLIYKDIDLTQFGVDSVYSNVYYDATHSRYTHYIWVMAIPGVGMGKDSVMLVYNTSGKVVTRLDYLDEGTGYLPGGKTEYTYAGSNIITEKLYSFNSGIYTEDFTITNEYDSKVAALELGMEGFLIDRSSLSPNCSANNIIKVTTTYPADPPETNTFSYQYNTFNKPVSGYYTTQPGNLSYSITFYYQ